MSGAFASRVRPSNALLDGLEPYDPKTIPAEVMISANENTRNIPACVLDAFKEKLGSLAFNRYPDPLAGDLREMIASANGLGPECVLIGNGGDEIIFNTLLTWGGQGRKLLNTPPAFSVYDIYAQVANTQVVNVARREDFSVDEDAVVERASRGDIDLVMITSPNNPTGNVVAREFVERLLCATDALVMIDEAYHEFSGTTVLPLLQSHENLMILRTFSKAYSLAAARVGYMFANPSVISEFLKVRQPYSVNALSQLAAQAVYENRAEFEPAIRDIIAERSRLFEALNGMQGVQAFESRANYLLVRIPRAHEVWERLLSEYSVLVRDFSRSAGLEDCLRISVGQHDENTRLLEALSEITAG